MMDADPGVDRPDREQQRHLRRLVSSLRARGGIGALSAECHGDVPGVDGVVLAVLAAHAGRFIISDSGPDGDQLEDLQATLGEGPGLDAATTGEQVSASDLDGTQAHLTWPRFAGRAPALGFRAVFAHPVLVDAQPVGVLSLYRSKAGLLSAADHEHVDRYLQAATVLFLDSPRAPSGEVSVDLPMHAAEVQQAVGVVMELGGVDADTALHRIRAYAHRSGRPMRDVVAEVRTCRLPFDPAQPA
jgi:hypothetical protein